MEHTMKHQFGTEALENLDEAIRRLKNVGYTVGIGLDEDDEMVRDLIELQKASRDFKRKYADRIKDIDNE